MSVRLRWVAHLALSLGTHSTEERVRGVLLALVESFGVEHEEGWLIDLGLTHEDLASMVGVSRQFVNGALNHIKQAGLIELGKRRIVVTRLDDLREVSLPPEGGPTAERASTRRSRGGHVWRVDGLRMQVPYRGVKRSRTSLSAISAGHPGNAVRGARYRQTVRVRIMSQAIARRLNVDQSDEQGPHLPCECGAGPLRPPPDSACRADSPVSRESRAPPCRGSGPGRWLRSVGDHRMEVG